MSVGMDRRLVRIERDVAGGVVAVASMLDSARCEQVEALQSGTGVELQARRMAAMLNHLHQLNATASARRLSPLEDRLRFAYDRVASAA